MNRARPEFDRWLGVAGVCACLVVASLGLHASAAQWTVYYLNPPDHPGSSASATTGTQRVGLVRVGSGDCFSAMPHAAIWEGTSSHWLDLNPTGVAYSALNATTGAQQAGFVRWEGDTWFHAALWSGTADSFVDLHPTGATESYAFGIGGTQQVGTVLADAPPHAAMWAGTADSYRDLNPAGSQFSVVIDTNGAQQVGYMSYDYLYGHWHAALWSGSAESFVDLLPSDAPGDAFGYGISPDGSEQVGVVQVDFGGYLYSHAAVWHGVADEWVDLNPSIAYLSEARGTDGTHQVGDMYDGVTTRAYIWSGSAASGVDLHALLPAEYTESGAEKVYTDVTGIWVVGSAHRTVVQCGQAILWHLPLYPAGDVNCDGTTDFRDINPFVLALSDPGGYGEQFPQCSILLADINGDGAVDFGDINPFVELLTRPES
jgi:hypothetical protein